MAFLTQQEIATLGVFLVNELSNELKRQKKVVSKDLINSLKFETKETGNFIELSVTAIFYAKFVDQGVKGNRSSRRAPKSPFRFRKKFPSKDFINNMVAWIRQRGLETGNIKIRDLAIAMAIVEMREGIKPSNFIDNTLKKAQQEINQKVEQMIFKKIDVQLDNIVKQANA